MKRYYFETEQAATAFIASVNEIQSKAKTFYNVTLKQSKRKDGTTQYCVVVG